MAIENKTPGIILSPAQGPGKPEIKKATVHINARGQHVVGTEPAIEKNLLVEEVRPDSSTINTENETMGDLAGKLEVAQSQGHEWVETTEANMIKLRPKKDWEQQGYFCHKGVKLCMFGKIEEIVRRESMTAHDRMHPGIQPTVISGAM